MKKHSQAGFSAIEVIGVLVLVSLIGFAGVTAYNQNKAVQTEAPTAANASVPVASSIHTTEDLSTAETALDESNIDASSNDSSQLDSELSSF